MAPPTRTPPSAWVAAARRALADGGPDAVRIDRLAATLGVTRGSFYAHFPTRQALLEAVLDDWERTATDDALAQVERRGGDAWTKAQRAGLLTFGADLIPVDLAIRDWARRDAGVAERLRRVDDRRMDYLRRQFAQICDDAEEVEARSFLAFSLLLGDHLSAAGHGARTRAQVLARAAGYLAGDADGAAGATPTRGIGSGP